MAKKYDNRRWRSEEKVQLLMKAGALNEEELGLFLRKNGLHSSDLELWKQEILEALDNTRPVHPESKTQLNKKVKKLEQELKEKDAIIEAQKKIQNLMEEEEKNTPLKSEKK